MEIDRQIIYKKYVEEWSRLLRKYLHACIVIFVITYAFKNSWLTQVLLILFGGGIILDAFMGFKYQIHSFRSVKSASFNTGKNSFNYNLWQLIIGLAVVFWSLFLGK